jgi:hypothetical protein
MGRREEYLFKLDDIGMPEPQVVVKLSLDVHCYVLWIPRPEFDSDLFTTQRCSIA